MKEIEKHVGKQHLQGDAGRENHPGSFSSPQTILATNISLSFPSPLSLPFDEGTLSSWVWCCLASEGGKMFKNENGL
jgi:hypothetical protein